MKRTTDEWGYPKNREHDFSNPEGNFATGVALVLAFTFIFVVLIGFFVTGTM